MEKSHQISFCVLWLSRGPSSHSTSQPPCEGAVFVVCSWRKSPARRGSNSSKISGVLAEPDSESKSVSEDTSVNLSARGQGPGMPGAALHPTARDSVRQMEGTPSSVAKGMSPASEGPDKGTGSDWDNCFYSFFCFGPQGSPGEHPWPVTGSVCQLGLTLAGLNEDPQADSKSAAAIFPTHQASADS